MPNWKKNIIQKQRWKKKHIEERKKNWARHFCCVSHFPSARSLFCIHGLESWNSCTCMWDQRAHNNQIQFCVCTLQADSHCSIFFWFWFSGEFFFYIRSVFFFAPVCAMCLCVKSMVEEREKKTKYWIESNIERLRSSNTK